MSKKAYKGISRVPSGQYVLHIPVYIEDGEPDDSGEIHVSSDYPLDSWWGLDEIIQVIDPSSIKELAEREKTSLQLRIEQLNEILKGD